MKWAIILFVLTTLVIAVTAVTSPPFDWFPPFTAKKIDLTNSTEVQKLVDLLTLRHTDFNGPVIILHQINRCFHQYFSQIRKPILSAYKWDNGPDQVTYQIKFKITYMKVRKPIKLEVRVRQFEELVILEAIRKLSGSGPEIKHSPKCPPQ